MDDDVTNSNSKDEPWDQAIIDLIPIPPASKDEASTIDPDNPFSMF